MNLRITYKVILVKRKLEWTVDLNVGGLYKQKITSVGPYGIKRQVVSTDSRLKHLDGVHFFEVYLWS